MENVSTNHQKEQSKKRRSMELDASRMINNNKKKENEHNNGTIMSKECRNIGGQNKY